MTESERAQNVKSHVEANLDNMPTMNNTHYDDIELYVVFKELYNIGSVHCDKFY